MADGVDRVRAVQPGPGDPPRGRPQVRRDRGHRAQDFPNQINNVLAFPGVFEGALDAAARRITEGMKLAAADAILRIVRGPEFGPDNIVPSALDPRVAPAVAEAVARAAAWTGSSVVTSPRSRGTGIMNDAFVRVITCEPNGHRVPVAAPR